MTMYFVYILYAINSKKSYVGYSNDIERRLWEHNNLPLKSYTSRFRPWILIHSEKFENKSQAMAREKWFKSGIG